MRKLINNKLTLSRGLLLAFAIFAAGPAHAYIGPGAGLGAIMIAVALILGIALLIFGFVWYPLRRFLRGRKETQVEDQE